MPHNLDLIITLTGGLSAALLLGLLTQSLRLSPIVGYLLAGVLIGPFTPGFVAHGPIAEQFAEIGVILLMFGVGLHFHLKELLAVKGVALPGAFVQITVATALGWALARWAGWSTIAGLVFGLAISVASTVVLLRMLADNQALHTKPGHVAVGWLVVEDVFTVFVLVLLPAIAGPGGAGTSGDIAGSLLKALVEVCALIGFTFLVGQRVIPWLLTYVASTRSRELFTLTVLVIALGIALGAAKLFGVSMALGAFLAGMVVGQSDFSSRAASEALPMRDAFAVLFFVAMGMLFDPASVMADIPLTLGALAIVLIAKPLAALVVVLLLRQPLRTGLLVAVALSQIGEFSFMLASMGTQLKVLPPAATQVLVVSSLISITLNPFLFKGIDPLVRILRRKATATTDGAPPVRVPSAAPRTIIVGYGPVGRTVTELLRENGVEPVIIELNLDTVRTLHGEGVAAVYGDATQPEILSQAGVATARNLIFAASGTPAEAVISVAKQLNPSLQVIARAEYLTEAERLKRAGASVIVTAEAEVALGMTERVLIGLGATPEQLDRERDRVRAVLRPTSAGDPVPALR